MLPIDVQAELILSFQEEKRQRFVERHNQHNALSGRQLTRRARLLRAGGNALIAAGQGLQRAAGVPLVGEVDSRRLGWEK